MAVDSRRVYLLYAVGVLLGIVTTFYFAFILLEDLSPTITAILLFVGFIVFGAAGLFTRIERLDIVFYALATAAYLIGLWYTIMRFEFGDVAVFLALALSSALFIGLGYLAHEGLLGIDRRTTSIVLVAVIGFGVLLIGVDLLGPQPTTELELEDEIAIPELGAEERFGTVHVHNTFVLSRSIDRPDVHACLYAPDRIDAPIRFEAPVGNEVLPGDSSVSVDLSVRSEAFYDREEETLRASLQDRETIPVELETECPEDVDDVTLVIIEGSPEQRYPPR